MSNISVLMVIRGSAGINPGGDVVQINQTARYLRELGVHVDVKSIADIGDVEDYDIIHFFNIIRPMSILPLLKRCKVPIVVSTIFVDYTEFEKTQRGGLAKFIFKFLSSGQIEYVKALARKFINGENELNLQYLLRGHYSSVKLIAEEANLLLPNSHSEANRLFAYLGKKYDYRKIVNAIEPDVFNSEVSAHPEFEGYVLCVGRIEGLKNQLNLIKAINQTPYKLALVGKSSSNHNAYYEMCKKEAESNKNVIFIDQLSHSELARIYKAAKVHVLPSWFETTGLSSLEAGVMGCNLVVSNRGDTYEYFGERVSYCDPDDVASIKDAIESAYARETNDDLRNYILTNYTWEIAARDTLSAYLQFINK